MTRWRAVHRPVDAVPPDRRWGGDNTDSGAAYSEPEPGAWPNRTIGVLYDDAMAPDSEGRFGCVLGPTRPAGHAGPFIALSADARGLLTRDYHDDPRTARRADWSIEVTDHAGLAAVPAKSDAAVSESLRSALRYARRTG